MEISEIFYLNLLTIVTLTLGVRESMVLWGDSGNGQNNFHSKLYPTLQVTYGLLPTDCNKGVSTQYVNN